MISKMIWSVSASNEIKGSDIVIVGQQPWDTSIGSNCKNIALEFSRHNRVLYVNSALDRITLMRSNSDPKVQKRLAVIQRKEKGLSAVQANLWTLYPSAIAESITRIKIRPLFNMLNKRNNRLFASSIQSAIDNLGFKDIILFNDNDIFRSFYLKELLKPAISIYYSRDYMLGVDYWKFHGQKLEPLLIAKSDLCVANSTYLANYCKQYNPRSYYVGQGCDLEMFSHAQQQPKPPDIAPIQGSIIGYVGALQSIRLDIEMLLYIAQQKPEWSVVLVGPEDEAFEKSSLHRAKNVHFLGSKKPGELPGYINAFDVCLNPQMVNQVTIGNYPRKIDEYLAVGKPVVATATEAMGIFADYTYLANSKEGYVELIEKALKESKEQGSFQIQQARKTFAFSHSWENSVKEIYAAINLFISSGNYS